MSDNDNKETKIKTTSSTGVTRFHLTEEDLEGISPPPPAATGDDKNEAEEEEDSIPILRRRRLRRRQNNTSEATPNNEDPICVIVVGMAGSGKTTLMAQLQRSLGIPQEQQEEETEQEKEKAEEEDEKNDRVGYCVNLDPATKLVPYGVSIDIRDTVDYKEVMRQHNLGPNGAIMTSLNLFATKFDQVMTILERRAYGDEDKEEAAKKEEEDQKQSADKSDETKKDIATTTKNKNKINYILVDTPGQIEAFTWSASGTIMGESLASSFPTVLAFVVDTPRCAASPHTFMSNMLYACSMLYRTRLPLVVVFNKTDVVSHDFAQEWMEDYEAFQEALDERSDEHADGPESTGYYASLTRSLSLVLDEFYTTLHKCGVSAATGDGVDDFWNVVQKAAENYETDYLEDLRNRIREQRAKKKALAKVGVRRLQRDLEEDNQR